MILWVIDGQEQVNSTMIGVQVRIDVEVYVTVEHTEINIYRSRQRQRTNYKEHANTISGVCLMSFRRVQETCRHSDRDTMRFEMSDRRVEMRDEG